jgi:hypothetical protein
MSSVSGNKNNEVEDYLPFKYDDLTNINGILKNTKTLIKNSKKFNRYIDKYSEKTQVVSFKLPEITTYPILKNKELISHNNTHYDLSNELNWLNKNKKNHEEKHRTVQNFFKLKRPEIAKEETKEKNKTFIINDASKKNLNIFNKTSSHSNNFIKFNELDLFLDLSSTNKISYEHDKIFNKTNYYENLIKEKVEFLKDMTNIENQTTNLVKKTNNDSKLDINLTLSSVKVDLKNLKVPESPIISTYLPLVFLPFFYNNDIQYFIKLLPFILKFNQTGDQISFDSDELLKLIKLTQNDISISENKQLTLMSMPSMLTSPNKQANVSSLESPLKSPSVNVITENAQPKTSINNQNSNNQPILIPKLSLNPQSTIANQENTNNNALNEETETIEQPFVKENKYFLNKSNPNIFQFEWINNKIPYLVEIR